MYFLTSHTWHMLSYSNSLEWKMCSFRTTCKQSGFLVLTLQASQMCYSPFFVQKYWDRAVRNRTLRGTDISACPLLVSGSFAEAIKLQSKNLHLEFSRERCEKWRPWWSKIGLAIQFIIRYILVHFSPSERRGQRREQLMKKNSLVEPLILMKKSRITR